MLMRRQDFEANLDKMRRDYVVQTGRPIGGETGVCSMIVLGVFTGANLNFHRPPTSPEDLARLEQRHGLVRADVHRTGIIVADAIRALFEQDRLSFHGIIAEGRILTGKRHPETERHSVAIAADEGRQPIGVVDSTAPGMFHSAADESPLEEVRDVGFRVQGRFLPYAPLLHLVLDQAGRETLEQPGRLFPIDRGLTVSMVAPR